MAELVPVLEAAGFADVEIVERFEPFEGTNKEHIAKKFGVLGVNVIAHKPL